MIGELAKLSVGKQSNTVRLLRHISHNCYVSNINALFRAYCCPSCYQIIHKIINLVQNLTTCKEKVDHVFPKNVYLLQKTLFGKSDSLNIFYFDDQKFFKNMAIFDFESVCVQEDKIRDIDTTT